jgi:hypothetical protein
MTLRKSGGLRINRITAGITSYTVGEDQGDVRIFVEN